MAKGGSGTAQPREGQGALQTGGAAEPNEPCKRMMTGGIPHKFRPEKVKRKNP
jgi:hypothetical protein